MKSTSLIGSAIQLTAVSLLSRVLYFLYQITLSRTVGTELLGLIHMAMPIYYTLLAFLTSGFGQAICKLSAEHQSSPRLELIYTQANRLFLLGFCLTSAALYTFYEVVMCRFLHTSLPLPVLITVPVLLLCTSQEIFAKQFFYGTGNIRIPSILQITEQLVRMSVIFLLLFLTRNRTPASVFGIIFTGMLVSEVYSSLHLHHLRSRQPITLSPAQINGQPNHTSFSRNILRIALPISCTTVLCQSMGTINAVLLPSLLTRGGLTHEAALERYGILFGMTIPLLSIPSSLIGSLSIVLLPHLSRARAQRNRTFFSGAMRESLLMVALVAAPATFLLARWCSPLGMLLYHQPEVGQYALPLAVGISLSAFEQVFETALNAYDCQRGNALITFLVTLLQMLLTLTCTVSMGLHAYVMGFMLSTAVSCLLRATLLLRQVPGFHRRRALPLRLRTTPGSENEAYTLHPRR